MLECGNSTFIVEFTILTSKTIYVGLAFIITLLSLHAYLKQLCRMKTLSRDLNWYG